MKLFFYYTAHCIKNGLKKIFKSWVLVFIIVFSLFTVIVILGTEKIAVISENEAEEQIEEVEEEEHTVESELGIGKTEAAELATGLVVLLIFSMQALSADKNGGKIFVPADIPILFASPLQPQSVLLFRLGTQLGTAVLFGLYLLFQVPNRVVNFGMSLSAALSVIVALALTVAVGKLLQVLLYMLCAKSNRFKDTLRYYIYGILAALFGLFFLRYKSRGGTVAQAAVSLFNGGFTRWLPLWGWLKGMVYYAVTSQWWLALAELLAIVAGIAVLVYIIYHMDADFYEDAMAKSEETAEALRRAQGEETSVAMGKRKKDRSEKLRRDDLRYGSGANVFFTKTVYNRFRFAHFGFMTKTMETYFLVALGVTAFCKRALETDPFYPVVMALAVIGFYRSLGDSLSTDVKMDFFLLIPESTEKKLFYSLLGNAFDCLLDLLPAMVLTVITGASPLRALVWMLLIVSLDFYGSTVVAFLDVSAPANAGKIVKNLIQVIFIYFGLIPDIALVALGVVLGHIPFAVAASAVVNVLLGVVFLSLIPRYIDPPLARPKALKPTFTGDMQEAKRTFSRVGFGAFTFWTLGSALQLLILRLSGDAMLKSDLWFWLGTFGPLYAVAFPLALYIMGKAPEEKLPKRALGFSGMLTAFILSVALMYLGNLFGTLVTAILANFSGKPAFNPVMGLISTDSRLLQGLIVVVIAPCIEEYTFRRTVIDRLHVYGQKRAVFISALLFGLFHGNLSQFFYAFLLGLVFGTVYVKTGRLRYSVALHMIVNFMGSVLAPWLLENLDTEALAGTTTENLASVLNAPTLLYFGYVGFMLLTTVLGVILMLVRRKELSFPAEKYESDGRSARQMSWGNPGMIVNLLTCLGFMVYVAFIQ